MGKVLETILTDRSTLSTQYSAIS
ncbi:unnamed protein product [Oppiella nova]|uniref:Uncharacterized protein n=1 Tax=Oppiella nova TaxID=334625 RepID=A0A7R9MNZ6_9ACAR|nr:unnamed protein product [Oppiella nova]CAG2180039.1 unnamed protein product [Oppiella nova]